MVKRHLLTLFVLLSGLAALQAPAHASSAETVAAQTRAIAGGCELAETGHALCAFVTKAHAEAADCSADTRQLHAAEPAAGVIIPYIFGVERALE